MYQNPADLEAGAGYEKNYASNEYDIAIRMGFIRKVYGILSAQLVVTTLIASIIVFVPPLTAFVQGNAVIFYTAAILPFILLLVLACVRESYPVNLIVLGLFTVCLSYTVGVSCTFYNTTTVLEAFFLTALVVVALTMYTFQSKRDFSFLGAGLFAALFVLIAASIIQIFVRSSILNFAISVGGAGIFSLYIVYDTWLLMERFSIDEYILAAINLYLDIINLFTYILRILAYLNNEGN